MDSSGSKIQETLDPYIDPICRIVVSRNQSTQMTLPQAIGEVTRFTQQKGKEAGFVYDIKTQKPVTPILAGSECQIHVAEVMEDETGLGHVHSHPIDAKEAEDWKGLFNRSACFYSTGDLKFFSNIFGRGVEQTLLVCPTTNELIVQEGIGNVYQSGHSELRPIFKDLYTAETISRRIINTGKGNLRNARERVFAAMDTIAKALNQRILPLDAFIEGKVKL